MTLAERRLNESILRSKILKELRFLLEISEEDLTDMWLDMPKDQFDAQARAMEPVGKAIAGWVSQRAKDFSEAWKEFKSGLSDPNFYISLGPEGDTRNKNTKDSLFTKAAGLAWNDIKELKDKDPMTLFTWVLDLISIIEPTGLADIIQGGILISQGAVENSALGIFFGVICYVAGFLTAAGLLTAIATEGMGTPIWVLAKATAISIKQITKLSITTLRKILSKNGDNMIKILKKTPGHPQSVTRELERVVSNSKKPSLPNQTVEQEIEQLTGRSITGDSVSSPISSNIKQKFIQTATEIKNKSVAAAKLVKDASPQILGATLSTSMTALAGSRYTQIDKAYEIMDKNICGDTADPEVQIMCNDIEIVDKYKMKFRSKSGNKNFAIVYRDQLLSILKKLETRRQTERTDDVPERPLATYGKATPQPSGPPVDATPNGAPPFGAKGRISRN